MIIFELYDLMHGMGFVYFVVLSVVVMGVLGAACSIILLLAINRSRRKGDDTDSENNFPTT